MAQFAWNALFGVMIFVPLRFALAAAILGYANHVLKDEDAA
jgi:hypothetical protein